jgi:hypothetical protein
MKPESVDSDYSDKTSKYRITLKTWFKKTYVEEEVKESDEKYGHVPEECTDPECFCFGNIISENDFDIDRFMLRNFNYKKYAVAVMFGFIDGERELLSDFVYQRPFFLFFLNCVLFTFFGQHEGGK